jgi:dolichol-phosphate mannosyltransferase
VTISDIAAVPLGGRPAHPPRISVVIPTYNERDNIVPLLKALMPVLPVGDSEVLFVDDSSDDTPRMIAAAAEGCPVPVSVLHRETPTGGLGGAVVEGLQQVQGAWVVVMDADLQHPPGLVAELVATGERTGADLVVASRYASGGNLGGLDGAYRRLVSAGSTALAKVAFARALSGISDPMSGFFAVRTAILDPADLRPLGYKILLELVVRSRPGRVVEVPFTFQPRHAGESKSSLREGVRFLKHLAMLRLGPTRARMLGYGVIGVSGVVPNLVAMWLFTGVLGMHYLPAAVVANQVAIAWNFVLTDLLLFRQRRRRSLANRLSRFFLLNNVDLVARIPLLGLLVGYLHFGYLVGTAITLVFMFFLRFALIDRVVYVPAPEPTTTVWETP